MLLICNAPDAVATVLENWKPAGDPGRAARLARLSPPAARQQDAARYAAGRAAAERMQVTGVGACRTALNN